MSDYSAYALIDSNDSISIVEFIEIFLLAFVCKTNFLQLKIHACKVLVRNSYYDDGSSYLIREVNAFTHTTSCYRKKDCSIVFLTGFEVIILYFFKLDTCHSLSFNKYGLSLFK